MREKVADHMKKTISKREIGKFIALMIAVHVIYRLFPASVASGMIIVVFGYAILRRLEKKVLMWLPKSRAVCGAKRTLYRTAVIFGMTDDQFEQAFWGKSPVAEEPPFTEDGSEANQASEGEEAAGPVLPTPNISPGACREELTEEAAAELAFAWWESIGLDKVDGIIQSISAETPQFSSCDLQDYGHDIDFPTDKRILKRLQDVMREYGLAAEYNDDQSFIICWSQDLSGKEAGEE